MRRNRIFLALILLLIITGGYFGYNQLHSPETEPEHYNPEESDDIETIIWASGEVLPAQWAELSFRITGRVEDILVSEGGGVVKGTSLIRLSKTEMENNIAIANAARQMAEAELVRAKAPARLEEIEHAEGIVMESEAALARARAVLRQTEFKHEHLQAGTREEKLQIALASLKKTEAQLRSAQAEYDKIKWYDAIGSSSQAMDLEQATLNYETAKAEYQEAISGATSQEISASQAQVEAAAADVKQAEALLVQAQASLSLLKAGPRPEDVRVAEARLAQASAELNRAVSELNEAVLHAPFDGTIGAIYVRKGELVLPEIPVITMGNLERLRVETTDLRETDIAQMNIGQPVELTFDAFSDVVLKGHVSHISPKSDTEKGSVNYRTIIELDEADPRLKWGMTAYANITVE